MALVIVLIAALLLVAFTFLRRRSPAVLRPIQAFERLSHAIGLAVENGTRLHISLGRGNLFTARGGSALAGLAMLRRLAERTSVSALREISRISTSSFWALSGFLSTSRWVSSLLSVIAERL